MEIGDEMEICDIIAFMEKFGFIDCVEEGDTECGTCFKYLLSERGKCLLNLAESDACRKIYAR